LAVNRSNGIVQVVDVASGKATPLTKENVFAADWSPDGSSILCADESRSRLMLFPVADGAKPQTIVDAPDMKTMFRFSPDGKYVAYESHERDAPLLSTEIYLAALPSFAVRRKLSTGGGNLPVWARSGKEIFYVERGGGDWAMMSVEVRTGSKPDAGTPKTLFRLRTTSPVFSVSGDGKRFLFSEQVQRGADAQPQISLVLNWAAELKQQ
jgi:Tol biopolymer transport system component